MLEPQGPPPAPPRSSAGAGGFRALKTRYSIAAFVILALVFITTLLLVGLGLYGQYSENQEERQTLRQDAIRNADQLATGLSLPLWNFDYSQVAKILDSTMQKENILGLIVTQADPSNPGNQVTYTRSRDAEWRSVNAPPETSTPGLQSEQRPIVAMGEPIGNVEVLVTSKFLEQALRKRLVSTLSLSVLIDLILIVSLYGILWWVILKPLRAIERYALAVKAGGAIPAGFHTVSFYGELESLRLSIGDMVALLQTRLGALLEKETTLTAVLNSVPQAVYWKDAQGRFLGCNKVFADAAGLESPGAILGKQDVEVPFHDEDLTVHHVGDLEVVRTGVPKIHVVECLQTSTGRVLWLDITKVPILDADGHPYAVLGVFEDITARKQAEEEHAHLQEQLNQSQKLESIGRLAGGVAHDNNNMLMAILMHAELLREQLGPESPALRHIKAMEGAAERSTALIRQLLAFSRKQVIEPKIIDLNELLNGFKKSIAPLVGEDIEFALKPGAELWKVKMDPVQVDQIVMNLVVNARDAMPKGGSISIETSNVQIDANYCRENPWALPGDYVLLSVSDTGIGMTAEIKRKIFEPFFTTKEVGKGTGLGLSTVFGIVKQNGGFLNVYSEPNLGATFRIYLHRCPEESATPEAMIVEALAHAGRGNILVVEDDEILGEVIPKILDRLGYTFLLADTPGEAVRLCRLQDVQIDVLLTDVVMPGMSGKELWEQVSQIRPDTKVIYMSGYTADVISRQGVLDSGVHFIQKPFSTAELGKKLQSVLGF